MIDAQQYQLYASNPAAFRDDLNVEVSGSVCRFGDIQDDWQRRDFESLDPAWLRCTGRDHGDNAIRTRGYLERGRGHSKTTDLAMMAIWALAFATRSLRGYCFAADKDQAALLHDAMRTLVRLNPWLAEILEVQREQVVNVAQDHRGNGSRLTIFTSDVGSSYGILPDFIIADELTHWAGDGSLWYSIISSAAKQTNCVLVVISNAGFVDSWQWNVREAARNDPSWIFSRLDGPRASWLTKDRLAEQRRMLPPIAYDRLWGNRWSSGGGDALTEEDIQAAFDNNLRPMTGRESDWVFVAGLDLGLKRDGSAVVVLAAPVNGRNGGRIRLAHHQLWRPQDSGGKVKLTEIEDHIKKLDRRFNLRCVGFDPWQAEHMAQRLEVHSRHRSRSSRFRSIDGPWMREVPPTGGNLRTIANLTIETFTDRRLMLFDCPPLERDLRKLRAEEKSYGVRLTSPRDEHGHGDSFTALANALLLAHEIAGEKVITLQAWGSGMPYDDGDEEDDRHAIDDYLEEMEYLESLPDGPERVIRGIEHWENNTNDPLL